MMFGTKSILQAGPGVGGIGCNVPETALDNHT